MYKFKIFYSKS